MHTWPCYTASLALIGSSLSFFSCFLTIFEASIMIRESVFIILISFILNIKLSLNILFLEKNELIFCMVKYHEDRLSWVGFSSRSGGESSGPRVRRLAGAFRRRCGDEGISNVAHQMAMGRLKQKRAQGLTSSNEAVASNRLPPVARARARAEPLRRPKLPRQPASQLLRDLRQLDLDQNSKN